MVGRLRAVAGRRTTGILAVAVLLLAVLAAGAGVADADSGLVAAQPPPGTHLAVRPAHVRLEFAAPLEAQFLTVEVWAAGRLRSLPARIDPTDPQAAIATLGRAAVPAGTAWVRWRALTTDGHVVSGRYPLQLGSGGGSVPPRQLGSGIGGWVTGIGRLAILVGLVLALGLVVLRWGVAAPAWAAGGVTPPGRPDDRAGFQARALIALTRGAGAWWAAWWTGLALWGLGAVVTGIGLTWWLGVGPSGLGRLVSDTRAGHALVALIACVLAVGAAGAGLRRRRAADAPAPATGWAYALGSPAVLGIIAVSWAGHASDGTDVDINIGADAIHTAAAAAWLGGLLGLLVLVVTPASALADTDRVRLLAAAVVRFSSLAIAAVAVLVITGTYRALAELGSLGQLLTTAYGIALTVKLAIFVVMLCVGGYSRLVLHPRLERAALGLDPSERRAGTELRVSLTIELALALALMVAVAVLVATTPPG